MLKVYDSIYFAPHLDDVALSCGGQISRKTGDNQTVLIVTVTAGDAPSGTLPPFAEAHHRSWNLSKQAVAERRAEDREACRILGADFVHWDVMDCIYRRNPATGAALYNNDEELFGTVHPSERALVAQLAARMLDLPEAHEVIAPLTLGNHVDHQLTRLAVELAYGNQIAFYEDYPYVQWQGGAVEIRGMTGHMERFSAENLQTKLQAIRAYKSQVPHLFKNDAEMQRMVESFHAPSTGSGQAEMGGERLWRYETH